MKIELLDFPLFNDVTSDMTSDGCDCGNAVLCGWSGSDTPEPVKEEEKTDK